MFVIRERIYAHPVDSANSQKGKHETSHKYEGWNFNSGNYLFTNDTK